MVSLAHCLPPAHDLVKFWVVRGPSEVITLGLGSRPKLNFSVIVTPACAVDMEAEVLVACGTLERGFPTLVGHVSVYCGRGFQILVVIGATNHAKVVAAAAREH